ncbi:MAG: hypothetical protein IJZ62_02775, partial [Clostridia bacterium]|nr:hypothetical protein [Clostridia bacterium]
MDIMLQGNEENKDAWIYVMYDTSLEGEGILSEPLHMTDKSGTGSIILENMEQDNEYYYFDFVNDKEYSVIYAQDLTLSSLDYEVYLDEGFTQKADNFSRLGNGELSLYIKINIEPTHALVIIEDLAEISLYGSFADYIDADLFNENYGDYFAFYPSASLVGTINGVDFAESEYVIEDEGSYYLDLEGGREYHIVVDTL